MKGKVWWDERQGCYRLFFPPNIYRQSRHDKRGLEKFLTYLRVSSDLGQFDSRDYQIDKPLAFASQVDRYLRHKLPKVRCPRNIKRHLMYAVEFFGNDSMREIGAGRLMEFEEWLPDHLTEKSKANIFVTLKTFWQWIVDYEDENVAVPLKMPRRWPVFDTSQSRMREILTKEDQFRILERVKENTWKINQKIYIGILWLLTYGFRPGEVRCIRMTDFDSYGRMHVFDHKGRRRRLIKLLPEDFDLVKNDGAIGEAYFFRHSDGKPFGKDYWWKHWRTAASQLGFLGVDLYGSTRHSSATDLSEEFTPEQIKAGWTEHTTSKSFYRYLQMQEEMKQRMYARARGSMVVLEEVEPKQTS